jgi:hypothetical protein
MALWLDHPKYVPARERLVAYLDSERYRFRRVSPVVFLCGGAGSARRDALRDYLHKHHPNLAVFYAEGVWEQIAAHVQHGALKMEADLAALADIVIIIVESPGTFAELGAFSLSDPLRKKLLPIIDKAYEDEATSFIATGPVRWINAESTFAPTVYAPLTRILEAVDKIEERIDRIPKPRSTKLDDLSASPKHLLFFLCDLIAVIYPATIEIIEHYIRRIAPRTVSSDISVPTLIGLAVAMGILRAARLKISGRDEIFFLPAIEEPLERPFHHRRLLDLPSQRADHVSILLTLPEAAYVIKTLRNSL